MTTTILSSQNEALMREDLITPIHDHDDRYNHLLAHHGGSTWRVSPEEAGALALLTSPYKDLGDPSTECTEDGPKNRGFGRRTLLKGALAGFGALAMASLEPRYAFAATPTGEILICIYLRGGFDGISAVVPVTDSNYYAARPTIGVKEANTTRLAGTSFGLNNHMQKHLAPMIAAGQAAFVVGAGNPGVTRSHFEDMANMERSAPANMRSGWLGRYLAANSSTSGTFRAITMGNRAALSLSTSSFETLAMANIKEFDINSWDGQWRTSVLKGVDTLYKNAGGKATLQMSKILDAVGQLAPLRTSSYTPAGGAVYPASPFGKQLMDVARIIKANMGLEVACVDLGDWDMHKGLGAPTVETDWFPRKALDLSQGLAAFRADLGDLWNKVTVVTMSEFGRRVEENGDLGVDHGHGNLMLVAGGGINGKVYGNMPALSKGNLVEGDVPITTDYRLVLTDILKNRFGASPTVLGNVFPSYTPPALLGIAKPATLTTRSTTTAPGVITAFRG